MQYNHSSINLSKHAVKRTQQRGIKPQIIDLITSEADRELPANDNCFSISISRKKLFYLKKLGKINPSIINEAPSCTSIIKPEIKYGKLVKSGSSAYQFPSFTSFHLFSSHNFESRT